MASTTTAMATHGGNFIAGTADGGRLFVSYLSPSGSATQGHLRVFDDSAWTPLDAWDDEVGSSSVLVSRNYVAVTTATRAGHAIFGAAPLGVPSLSRHYGCP